MANMVIFDLLNIFVKLQSNINSRKSLKVIVFSNCHASQSILKFTLPTRTHPLNFDARTFSQSFHIRMDCLAL